MHPLNWNEFGVVESGERELGVGYNEKCLPPMHTLLSGYTIRISDMPKCHTDEYTRYSHLAFLLVRLVNRHLNFQISV